jgi:hypothetical protein
MKRSPNPWHIGLRELNPAGARETLCCCSMVGHSEEVGFGYVNAKRTGAISDNIGSSRLVPGKRISVDRA